MSSKERRLDQLEAVVTVHDDSESLESARWLLKLMLSWPPTMMLNSRVNEQLTRGEIDELKIQCRLAREKLLQGGQQPTFKQALDTLPVQCVRGVVKYFQSQIEDSRNG